MKDYIVSINYGRIKWINAIYMTAQLNNSYTYAYNSPSRWVDILGLRPGDVLYDIDMLVEDFFYFTLPLVTSNKIEYGTGIRYVEEPYYGVENVCIQAYTYTMPYGWPDNEWDPSRAMGGNCDSIILIHFHTYRGIEGPSNYDINITNYYKGIGYKAKPKCPNFLRSIIVIPDGRIYYYP